MSQCVIYLLGWIVDEKNFQFEIQNKVQINIQSLFGQSNSTSLTLKFPLFVDQILVQFATSR